jgi:hypothetical protein
MSPGPVLTTVIKQAISDVLPNGMRSVESNRVHLLNLDNARATCAFDPEHVPWNLG